jgi:hypothetical protein
MVIGYWDEYHWSTTRESMIRTAYREGVTIILKDKSLDIVTVEAHPEIYQK